MTDFSTVSDLLDAITAKTVKFTDIITFIDNNYNFTPIMFKNGDKQNQAGENNGSAKVFAFAQLNKLDKNQTLNLFVEHYESVINTPDGNDHDNIRNFMQHGWAGILMETNPLTAKNV